MLFLSPYTGYIHDTLLTLSYGQDISVASSMHGFDLYFCFIDFMIYFTDFLIPVLVTGMILWKHLHVGKIVSVTSSMNAFCQYLCFIDFMICFTDFKIFLISLPLQSKGVLMLYPWLHMPMPVHVSAHGLLGSVFAFRSISQQL